MIEVDLEIYRVRSPEFEECGEPRVVTGCRVAVRLPPRDSTRLADGWTIVGSLKKRGGSWFEFIDRAITQLAHGILPTLIPSTPV